MIDSIAFIRKKLYIGVDFETIIIWNSIATERLSKISLHSLLIHIHENANLMELVAMTLKPKVGGKQEALMPINDLISYKN